MDSDNGPRRDDEHDEPAPRAPDDELELIPLDEPEEIAPPTPAPSHRFDEPHAAPKPAPKSGPKSAPKTKDAPKEKPASPLVRPGLGGPKAALIAGVVLLVGAMVAAAIRISGLQGSSFSDSTLAVFYVLYMTLLHTMTGFAALLIAAKVAGRELGKAELGAARMFAAVAAFALVANLTIPIPTRLDELFLAAVAYTLVVWGWNRLPRVELGIVVTSHALLLIAVALGSLLDGAYTEAKSKLGPPKPRVVEPEAQTPPAETAPTP
ncbi:MAG: hypothetical protein R3B57_07195 [Phycisphaerales bacterium]